MAYGTDDVCSFVSMTRCVFSAFLVHVFLGACLSYLLGATTKNRGYPGVIIKPLYIGMPRFDLKLLHLCVGFVFLGFRQDASLVV
jgi:hypothetical protein